MAFDGVVNHEISIDWLQSREIEYLLKNTSEVLRVKLPTYEDIEALMSESIDL